MTHYLRTNSTIETEGIERISRLHTRIRSHDDDFQFQFLCPIPPRGDGCYKNVIFARHTSTLLIDFGSEN